MSNGEWFDPDIDFMDRPQDVEQFDRMLMTGRQLRGSNARRGYGLEVMRQTNQTSCAYCGMDFTKEYEKWSMLTVDHAVPVAVCKANEIPDRWCEDIANMVLACATCNGFCNRYSPSFPVGLIDTEQAFFAIRAKVLEERRKLIAARHEDERRFFKSAPWNRGR